MAKKKDNISKFEYKAEMNQLLSIIIHSLYTHPEVFLRELISNASDALNKVRFKKITENEVIDRDVELAIRIELDSKKKRFSIEDSGIGMTKDELVNNIGTVARSGTLDFLKQLKEQNRTLDETLIGQFGVGFYSTFMVADEVTIETLASSPGSKGFRWRSQGEGTYTIEEIDRSNRGTKIFFTLKESAKDFCEEYKVKEIVNKYSNFADFPIYIKDEKINKVTALWHKNKKDISESELKDFYKFIFNEIVDPQDHLHISIEGGVNFRALLFIPSQAPVNLMKLQEDKSLHLYCNKILIQNDCKDLLPDYLRFIKGVVDTTDLPLNVSREITQSSPVMAKIKAVLTREVLALLESWAKSDIEKYDKFYKNFGPLLSFGVNMDFENRNKLIGLIRFRSTMCEGESLTSFKDYVTRMKKNQNEIYYVSGQGADIVERNPNLEYFKKNSIEVILLTNPTDVFIVPSIGEYDKKQIKSIDKSDIELMPEDKIEKPDDKLSESLIALFKEVLAENVEDVTISKRLVDSPVTLVTGKDALDPQMEKVMKMMGQEYKSSKKIMEVNMGHLLVKNLAKIYLADKNNPMLKACILQLYEGALLIDGSLPSMTEFIKRMTGIMEEATK